MALPPRQRWQNCKRLAQKVNKNPPRVWEKRVFHWWKHALFICWPHAWLNLQRRATCCPCRDRRPRRSEKIELQLLPISPHANRYYVCTFPCVFLQSLSQQGKQLPLHKGAFFTQNKTYQITTQGTGCFYQIEIWNNWLRRGIGMAKAIVASHSFFARNNR